METPRCARCDDRVYLAERYVVLGKTWHKSCFRCSSCSKRMELGKHLEHGGDPYCQGCYAKNFGPRGYGYGMGAGILSGNYDGQSPTQAPATSASWRKLNIGLDAEDEDEAGLLQDQEDENDVEEVIAAASKRLSSSSRRSASRRTSNKRRSQSRHAAPSFDNYAEEPEEEPQEWVAKRRSKRHSKRRSVKLEEPKSILDQLKELCGCGRETVRDY